MFTSWDGFLTEQHHLNFNLHLPKLARCTLICVLLDAFTHIELCMLKDDISSLRWLSNLVFSLEISEWAQNVVFLMTHQVYQCINLHFLSLLFYPSCLLGLLGVVDLFLPFLRATESDEFWSRDLKRGSHVFMTISSIHIVQGFRPFGWLEDPSYAATV